MKTRDLQYKQAHRWGYKDSYFILDKQKNIFFKSDRPEYALFANRPLPDFIPFVEKELGIKITEDFKNNEVVEKKISPPRLNRAFVTAVKKKFKQKVYSFEKIDRLTHSHGQTTSEEIYKVLYNGVLPRAVDMVFFCASQSETLSIIDLAQRYNVCLIPYGGGTSVSCALALPENESRMIVSVDMRNMNKILWLNKENRLAKIEAGITGRELEEKLNAQGYTMGHEPDSMEFSTLGGWISTFASGMKKNKYGNIEDMIENVNLITPKGVIRNLDTFDRSSIGIQPKGFVLGSEGNFGIITDAVVKIHKRPQTRRYNSLIFPEVKRGIDFLKALSKSDYLPASVRLVDNSQFRFGLALKIPSVHVFQRMLEHAKKYMLLRIKKMHPSKMSLATLVMEGGKSETDYQERAIIELSKKYGAVVAGADNGKRGYLLTHIIAYIRDFLADYHCIGETLETTVPWDRIEIVCKKARATVLQQHQKHRLQGNPYFSYRITQLYHSSVCIYFMVGLVIRGLKNPEEVFSKIEKEIRTSVLKNGGSLSHHHGVGKLRQPFLLAALSKRYLGVLQQIKKELDPKNIFGIRNSAFK